MGEIQIFTNKLQCYKSALWHHLGSYLGTHIHLIFYFVCIFFSAYGFEPQVTTLKFILTCQKQGTNLLSSSGIIALFQFLNLVFYEGIWRYLGGDTREKERRRQGCERGWKKKGGMRERMKEERRDARENERREGCKREGKEGGMRERRKGGRDVGEDERRWTKRL